MFGAVGILFALGVFVPGGVLAGKAVNENIIPAVFVEIEGKGEKVVRVSVVAAQCAFKTGDGLFGPICLFNFKFLIRGVVLMADLKIRAFPPVGAGDHVLFSIMIEISESGALGPELLAQLNLLKSMQFIISGRDQQSSRKEPH